MNINKSLGAMVSLTAVGLSIAACGGASENSADEEVVIGGIHPRTGAQSYYGLPMDNGASLAVDQINEAGGIDVDGGTVMLRYNPADDASSPTDGVAAFQQLTSDGTDFIVGPMAGAVVNALKPVVETSDALLMIDGAADPNPSLLDPPNMFRLPPDYTAIDAALLETLESQQVQDVAILNDNENTTFAGSLQTIVDGLEDAGANVAGTQQFVTGDSDFSAQLTNLLSGDHPDSLVVRGYAEESALVTGQARDMGFEGSIFWEVLAPPETVESVVSPGALEGVINVIYPTPDFYAQMGEERVLEFNEAYENEFDEEPGAMSANSYDSVVTFARGMEEAESTDPSEVATALATLSVDDVDLVNSYESQEDGSLFNEEGQAHFTVLPGVWREGQWVPLDVDGEDE